MYNSFKIKEMFVRHLLNNFNEGIVLLNSSFEIIYISRRIQELTGFETVDLLGTPVDRLFPSNADILKASFAYGEIPSSIKFYKPIRCKNSKVFNARIRLAKEIDRDGNLLFIIYIKDNTPFQRLRNDIIKKSLSIEQLSRSRKIRDGKLNDAVFEILQLASRAVNTQRVNAWVMDKEHSRIICIGNFDAGQNRMVDEEELPRMLIPGYFNLFETEKIIISIDAMSNPKTAELVDIYLKPHNIHSMMDIPIRTEGDIIGVVCFEHTAEPREWNLQEQMFGLVIAQMISLAMETHKRREAAEATTAALKEQQTLLKELQHRVKNNMSVLSGLVSIQAGKVRDEYHEKLFSDLKNRIESITSVQDLLYKSESYSSVKMQPYLREVLKNVNTAFEKEHQKVKLTKSIDESVIDISVAIPVALIATELVTNSYKYAFPKDQSGQIDVSFTVKNNLATLKVTDNGKGFKLKNHTKPTGGLDIVRSLAEQIGATIDFVNTHGASFTIKFPLHAA